MANFILVKYKLQGYQELIGRRLAFLCIQFGLEGHRAFKSGGFPVDCLNFLHDRV